MDKTTLGDIAVDHGQVEHRMQPSEVLFPPSELVQIGDQLNKAEYGAKV
jgi:hypothetical protein